MKILEYSDSQENKLIELSYGEYLALRGVIKAFTPLNQRQDNAQEMIRERNHITENMVGIFEFCASVGAMYQAMKTIEGNKLSVCGVNND